MHSLIAITVSITLSLPMISNAADAEEPITPSTITIPTSPFQPESDVPTNYTAIALEKFTQDCFDVLTDPHKYRSAFSQSACFISEFYHSMVLVHLRHQNYVIDFLRDVVSFNHIVGLAIAYDEYKDLPITGGYIATNGEFLTQVLRIYISFDTTRTKLANETTAMRSQLYTEIRSLKATNKTLETARRNIEKAYDSIEDSKDKLKEDLTSTRQALFEVQRQIDILRNEKKTKELQSQQHIEVLSQELQELTEENARLKAELRALQNELSDSSTLTK